jgi:hypothetical protein
MNWNGLPPPESSEQPMTVELTDRIYECAFVPELWPEVLRELADIAAARAGFLFVSNGDIHRWKSSTTVGSMRSTRSINEQMRSPGIPTVFVMRAPCSRGTHVCSESNRQVNRELAMSTASPGECRDLKWRLTSGRSPSTADRAATRISLERPLAVEFCAPVRR